MNHSELLACLRDYCFESRALSIRHILQGIWILTFSCLLKRREIIYSLPVTQFIIPIWKLGILISSDVRYVCVCVCVCLCVCVCVSTLTSPVTRPNDFKFYAITAEVNISPSIDFGKDSRSETGSSGSN